MWIYNKQKSSFEEAKSDFIINCTFGKKFKAHNTKNFIDLFNNENEYHLFRQFSVTLVYRESLNRIETKNLYEDESLGVLGYQLTSSDHRKIAANRSIGNCEDVCTQNGEFKIFLT